MIRKFKIEDLDQINGWYRENGNSEISLEEIPDHCYLEDRVACGFLYRTDAKLVVIEGYVTNPAAPSQERHRALNEITEKLLQVGKDYGFSKVIAITQDPSIMERALQHGFEGMGWYYLFSRGI